jgi:hypothetical protein
LSLVASAVAAAIRVHWCLFVVRHFPPRFDEKTIRRFVVGELSLREWMVHPSSLCFDATSG